MMFIYYLQLIGYYPWSSPVPIDNQTSEQNTRPISDNTKKRKNKHTKQRSIQPGLCGLQNIGNTCFMNSAIQCLSNIPELTKWAKTYPSSSDKLNVTHAYTSLIQSMWSGGNECMIPSEVKRTVSRHASIFTDFGQKDSHEFMNSLLNALHTELAENDSSESIVTELFRIRTESRVTCETCKIPDSAEEIIYCLPLPLGDEPQITLQTLLNDFTKEELLDGQYYCSRCDGFQPAQQKTSLLLPLPPVIVVQLKRFTFDETDDKLNTFVDYPVSNWQVDSNDENSIYDLSAISMHVGNLRGGHYTTLARLNGGNQWYHFNDSCVQPFHDCTQIVNRNAYVLVYLKRN